MKRLLLLLILLPAAAMARSPAGSDIDLEALLQRSWRIDHFRGFDNLLIGYRNKPDMVLLSRGPRSSTRIDTERLIQLRPVEAGIEARDLVLFKSGKLRGTGILVDDYGPDRPMQIRMWLPALRKVRRFSEPSQDDIWGGSHLTYGDLYLRRPEDETHRRVEGGAFPDCLEDAAEIGRWANRRLKTRLQPWCGLARRELVWIESRPLRPSPHYDRRLRLLDAATGAEYQSEYFKEGRRVKRLQKNWFAVDPERPEALVYGFWSVRIFAAGGGISAESLAWVPREAYEWNRRVSPKLWSEKTLRRLKR
jgi:hypothetical protein